MLREPGRILMRQISAIDRRRIPLTGAPGESEQSELGRVVVRKPSDRVVLPSGWPEWKARLVASERDESGIRREENEIFSFRHAQ